MIDQVKDALQDLVGLYAQVETIKLQNQLAKAAISNQYADAPSQMKNAQAKAASVTYQPLSPNNTALLVGAVIVGAIGVYLLVKK